MSVATSNNNSNIEVPIFNLNVKNEPAKKVIFRLSSDGKSAANSTQFVRFLKSEIERLTKTEIKVTNAKKTLNEATKAKKNIERLNEVFDDMSGQNKRVEIEKNAAILFSNLQEAQSLIKFLITYLEASLRTYYARKKHKKKESSKVFTLDEIKGRLKL